MMKTNICRGVSGEKMVLCKTPYEYLNVSNIGPTKAWLARHVHHGVYEVGVKGRLGHQR